MESDQNHRLEYTVEGLSSQFDKIDFVITIQVKFNFLLKH